MAFLIKLNTRSGRKFWLGDGLPATKQADIIQRRLNTLTIYHSLHWRSACLCFARLFGENRPDAGRRSTHLQFPLGVHRVFGALPSIRASAGNLPSLPDKLEAAAAGSHLGFYTARTVTQDVAGPAGITPLLTRRRYLQVMFGDPWNSWNKMAWHTCGRSPALRRRRETYPWRGWAEARACTRTVDSKERLARARPDHTDEIQAYLATVSTLPVRADALAHS